MRFRIAPPAGLSLALLLVLGVARLPAAAATERLNVVFILSDDQGAWALRSAGARELK